MVKVESVTKRKIEPVFNFTSSTSTYLLSGKVVHNCDTIAMLAQLTPWKPSNESTASKKVDGVYNHHIHEESPDIRESYIV